MPDYTFLAGSTSKSVNIFIFDPATGLPDNTVIHSTAGLALQYRREGAVNVSIIEVTLAALTTAWTDSGFLLIGNGVYRLDVPNLAFAAGATGVQIHGTLTSRVVLGPYVHLVAYDPFDAVRLGLTALPNVASGSAGAIPTTGTGANQLSVSSGHVTLLDGSLVAAKIGTDAITAAKIQDGAIDANTFAAGAINAAAIASDAITAAKIAVGAIEADAFAAGAINAAAIATDAIDADALAADAVTEIQSGLSPLTLATALPGSPTADTVGDALKRASVGIPQSAAGATGGLATFDDVSLGVIFGSVDDASAAAAGFIGNAGLSAVDDYYNGRFLIFTNNTLGARKITDYVGATKTFSFSGSAGEADQAFPDDPTNGDTFIIFGFHGE